MCTCLVELIQIQLRTESNSLWKLTTQPKGCLAWNDVDMTIKSKTPSPRCVHTGWEHSGKLWVFGGSGPSPTGYLNDNGDHVNGYTNQLLCFDPSGEEWVNPKCSGAVPSPRSAHATTVTGNKVWLYDGRNIHVFPGELYKLSMHPLIWIQIQINGPNPMRRCWFTLDAVGDNKIGVAWWNRCAAHEHTNMDFGYSITNVEEVYIRN